MAQHDYVIDNSTGANVRADINSVLQAIASNNSGSSEPSTTYALQFYGDTTNNILKLRNAANDGFINLFTLAGGVDVDAASNFNEDVTFTGASANIVFDKSDSCLEFADNAKAKFGSGDDLQLYHDSNNSLINAPGTGNLIVQSANDIILRPADGEVGIDINANGSVELYFDNSKKFETTSNGVTSSGNVVATVFQSSKSSGQGLSFADTVFLNLGTGDDLKIFHDGNDSYIEHAGGGNLRIETTGGTDEDIFLDSNDDIFLQVADGSDAVKCTGGGAVELYFNGSKKFETSSAGAIVTGELTTTSVGGTAGKGAIAFGSSGAPFIEGLDSGNHGSGSQLKIADATGESHIICKKDNAVEVYFDNSKKLETTSGGINVTGAITVNGSALSAGGKLLQVVQDTKGDKFSTTSSSFVDVTGLSLSITPSSSSNKVLVRASVSCGMGGSGIDAFIRLIRDTGANVQIGNSQCVRMYGSEENFTFVIEILDTPNTTSAITYKIQANTNSNEVFINRDGSNNLLGGSSITAMEID